MVSDKKSAGLLELIQLYKQTPGIRAIFHFIFTIYQNYMLAIFFLRIQKMCVFISPNVQMYMYI